MHESSPAYLGMQKSDDGVSVRGHPFSETEYLEMNPDVRAAVGAGQFKSGREHFEFFGIKEGRIGRTPEALGLEGFFGEQKIDLQTVGTFRAEKFPYAGPHPWLDRDDWPERVDEKIAAGKLTPAEGEMCRFWARNGYLILERCVDSATLDHAWSKYEEAIAAGEIVLPAEKVGDDDPYPGRFLDPHLKVPAMCAILRHATILRWVNILMDRQPAPFQTITSHKGSQQGAHSDSIHMTTYPLGYLTAAWVAFEDIHPDSGPLMYYPGSHRLPYLFSKDVGIQEGDFQRDGGGMYWGRYEPAIRREIEEHRLEVAHFHARKGDVLIWHANLIHGGSKRHDVKRSRRALVCHYFVHGAVTYHDLSGSRARGHTGTCLVGQSPAS
jgi:hypothetical protein